MNSWKLGTLSLTSALIAAASLASAPPAAGYEDTFCVLTVWTCNRTAPVPKGLFRRLRPGVPDNDKGNDDYVVVDDFARMAMASRRGWRNGALLGSRYNGKGQQRKGDLDPYGTHNNIKKGDYIGLEACIVDGPSGAPFRAAPRGRGAASTVSWWEARGIPPSCRPGQRDGSWPARLGGSPKRPTLNRRDRGPSRHRRDREPRRKHLRWRSRALVRRQYMRFLTGRAVDGGAH